MAKSISQKIDFKAINFLDFEGGYHKLIKWQIHQKEIQNLYVLYKIYSKYRKKKLADLQEADKNHFLYLTLGKN